MISVRGLGLAFALLVCLTTPSWGQRAQLVRAKKTVIGLASGINRLVGNVVVREGKTVIQCDSAHWDTRANLFYAYGQVRLKQGKDIEVKSHQLQFDMGQGIAVFRGRVVAALQGSEVRTEGLTYNKTTNTAQFYTPSTISMKDVQLSCRSGTLNTATRTHSFQTDVRLVQEKDTLRCVTLLYNDKTKDALFTGPGSLRSDSTLVQFQGGRWNSKSRLSLFWGDAQAKQPTSLVTSDTLERVAKKDGWLAKGKVRWFSWGRGDSLVLMSDEMILLPEFASAVGSARLWSPTLQAAADSMRWDRTDSTLTFFRKKTPPVAFAAHQQMQADTLFLSWRNGHTDSVYMAGSPLVSSLNDNHQVDQMAGKWAYGKMNSQGMEELIIRGNATALYHAWDDQKYLGPNITKGPMLKLQFIDSKLHSVFMDGGTTGTLSPENSIDSPSLPGYLDRRSECPSKTEAMFGRK